MDDALAAAVTEAMEKYARACSAVLWVREGGEWSLGAATCIALGDRLLLATAGHVLAGIRQQSDLVIAPWGTNVSSERIAFPRINFSDEAGNRDVGWVEIEREVATARGLQSIDLRSLAPYEQTSESKLYLAYGAPAELRELQHQKPFLDVLVTTVGYLTIPVCNAPNDVDITLEYQGEVKFSNPDRGRSMPNPKGMSGGGIWSIANYDSGVPWSPSKCKFVGTIRGYSKAEGTLRGVQLQHWLNLVRQDFPELETVIDSVLCRKPS